MENLGFWDMPLLNPFLLKNLLERKAVFWESAHIDWLLGKYWGEGNLPRANITDMESEVCFTSSSL